MHINNFSSSNCKIISYIFGYAFEFQLYIRNIYIDEVSK